MRDDDRGMAGSDAEHAILVRMLADAERLCGTVDPLLSGQAAHLRGRIAAMVEITTPPSVQAGARS
jgi:hypothetical protein